MGIKNSHQGKMETLQSNMSREIKRLFDEHLKEDLETSTWLSFENEHDFQDYYDDYVRFNFYGGSIDMDLFRHKYDFDWFDAFKLIKQFHDGQEAFDDYDDEKESWIALCNVCAWNSTFYRLDEYKQYIIPPKEKFIKACNIQIKDLEEPDTTNFERKTKLLKKATIQYYEYLKKFDIDNANKNLQVINLLFQAKMKEFEKATEQQYIDVCKLCKKKYEHIIAFKHEAIKIKDL
jgi:hypothetical protein